MNNHRDLTLESKVQASAEAASDTIAVPKLDSMEAENLHLRIRLLERDFELAQLKAQTEITRLQGELNVVLNRICHSVNVRPDEYELDLAKGVLVRRREAPRELGR